MHREPSRTTTDSTRGFVAVALGGLWACQLATARPPFEPVPEASHADVALSRADATARLAEALREDSIPVSRIELRDGYLESPWFDVDTRDEAASGRTGTSVVRVRGWVEPARVRQSEIRVETVFRRVLDPSLAERELERAVPPDHPVAQRVDSLLARLARRHP